MKIEFEGQPVENLDKFWINWQLLCYRQACDDWAEKKEVLEFLNEVEDHVMDDFLKRKAGGIYMDKTFSKRLHEIPVPMTPFNEKVYDGEKTTNSIPLKNNSLG